MRTVVYTEEGSRGQVVRVDYKNNLTPKKWEFGWEPCVAVNEGKSTENEEAYQMHVELVLYPKDGEVIILHFNRPLRTQDVLRDRIFDLHNFIASEKSGIDGEGFLELFWCALNSVLAEKGELVFFIQGKNVRARFSLGTTDTDLTIPHEGAQRCFNIPAK